MRYVVAFLIAIGLIVLFVILLLRAIFSGGGGDETPRQRINLTDYENTGVVMRMITDGPVNANELHRQIRIEVGRDANVVQIIHGYQGEIVRQERVANNVQAYGNFLRAIDLLGYTNGNESKQLEDYRGYCPTGNRYIFQIVEGSTIRQQFWSTSCGDSGSFHGQTDRILELFRAQIPGYQNIVQGVGLN